jgi:cell division protease FtsH
MIAYAGMSDKLPNLCYYNNNEYSFQRPYSDSTAELIDNEVKELINSQYERAKQILTEQSKGHAELAKVLLEREVILAEDVEKIFGKRPWASRSEEILDNESAAESTDTTDTNDTAETAEIKE